MMARIVAACTQPATGERPPLRTLAAVRASAPVTGSPPNAADATLATPCVGSQWGRGDLATPNSSTARLGWAGLLCSTSAWRPSFPFISSERIGVAHKLISSERIGVAPKPWHLMSPVKLRRSLGACARWPYPLTWAMSSVLGLCLSLIMASDTRVQSRDSIAACSRMNAGRWAKGTRGEGA
jgi:hypothetical protein